MKYQDYYKIMGVERDASDNEIKKNYRRLAKKYHPDVSKDPKAEEKFKSVGEAYEVLKDPEKRAAYDQLGENWKAGQQFNPPPGYEGFDFNSGGFTQGGSSQFSDFFQSIFGQGFSGQGFQHNQRQYSSKGQDINATIKIDLEDSFKGTSKTINMSIPEYDSSGRQVNKSRQLNIKIPKGIKAGQKIRLSGQGSPSLGSGTKGDLFLKVDFNPHHLFQLEGNDLLIEVPIAPWEAALGAKIEVPSPTGKVAIKIPENTHSGKKMRLKGKGLPTKTPGNLFVIFQIETPAARSEDEKEFYHSMEKTFDFNPRKHM